MHITCTHEHLKESLKKIDGIVSRNITLPILENILVEAKEGFLFCSATNLEIGVITQVAAKIKKSGGIVVPPQLLQGFLNAISGEDHVTLYTKKTTLFLESGTFKTSIKGFDTNDYPIIPQIGSDDFFRVHVGEFQKMIRKVVHFVTMNDIRPELTGVTLQEKEGKLYSAATDSFRLGEYCEDLSHIIIKGDKLLHEENIIIPQKLCTYINKITSDEKEIKCAIKDGHFFVYYDNTHVTARLIDGVYPDYTQIIPQKTKTNIIVKRNDLIEAMRVMLIFSNQEMQEVHFTVADESIYITTNEGERGGGEAKISASIDGENQKIILNPRYVLEGLQNIDQEDIYIGINNEASPIVFYGSDKNGVFRNYTYIVMPVKSTQ